MDVGGPLNGAEYADTVTFDRPTNPDDALRYVTYLTFDHHHSFISSCHHYSRHEEWSKMWQYVLECSQLPEVFENLPSSVIEVFKGTRESLSRLSVIALEESVVSFKQTSQ